MAYDPGYRSETVLRLISSVCLRLCFRHDPMTPCTSRASPSSSDSPDRSPLVSGLVGLLRARLARVPDDTHAYIYFEKAYI